MSFASVELEISTREEALAAFVAKMQEHAPGWLAAESDPLLWTAEWWADAYPDLADLMADMSALAFRQFGEQVLGIPPISASAASALTTWTLTDTDGHTIPAGTQVQIANGDDLYGFATVDETIVLNGSSSATNVEIRALVTGEEANELAGDPTLIDALSFVASIEQTSTETSGGADAEDEDAFLSRLKDTITLLSQNIVLPEDAAVLARSVAGVARATAIDTYYPGVNEVQRLSFSGTPSSGTSTLTYSGQTTTGVTITETAASLKARLEALSNIAVGDVVVTGGPLPAPIDVEFTGNLAHTNVAAMTVTDSMTGGDLVVTTTTAGVAHNAAAEKTVTVVVVDEDGAALAPSIKTAIEDLLELHREVNFLFYVRDPFFNAIAVDVDVVPRTGADPAGVEAAVEQAIQDYLDPANWGVPGQNEDGIYRGGWKNQPKVRYFDIAALIENVDSVDHIASGTLQISFEGGTPGTVDLTLLGAAPLTTAGTITVDAV